MQFTAIHPKGSFYAAFFKRAILPLAVAGLLSGCAEQPPVTKLSGSTMGTTYNVVVIGELRDPTSKQPVYPEQLQSLTDERLVGLNDVMSTYIDDSELSKLNKNSSTACIPISQQLRTVLISAQAIAQSSGGAFDITVGPLVNAWGFGPDKRQRIPTQAQLAQLRAQVGYQKLSVAADCVSKALPELYIDLSAIAKGYGSDEIAALLESLGATRYLVEIGGEIRVRGKNPQDTGWGLAIEVPQVMQRKVQKLLRLEHGGVATSGDYRNYYEVDGVRYSHTINPLTGQPITHKLVSVTVVADTAMRADALATAISVLGPEKGLKFADSEKVAALLVVKTASGFKEIPSGLFNKRFGQE